MGGRAPPTQLGTDLLEHAYSHVWADLSSAFGAPGKNFGAWLWLLERTPTDKGVKPLWLLLPGTWGDNLAQFPCGRPNVPPEEHAAQLARAYFEPPEESTLSDDVAEFLEGDNLSTLGPPLLQSVEAFRTSMRHTVTAIVVWPGISPTGGTDSPQLPAPPLWRLLGENPRTCKRLKGMPLVLEKLGLREQRHEFLRLDQSLWVSVMSYATGTAPVPTRKAIREHSGPLISDATARSLRLLRNARVDLGLPPALPRDRAADAVDHAALVRTFPTIIGRSPAMTALRSLLDKYVRTIDPVLIQGETGTGKELVARAFHTHGPRSAGPFIPLNCAAIPEALIESELFGHEKDTFPGAQRRLGYFVLADGGTLFLDEVGVMAPAMQEKLLRVLGDKIVFPLGSSSPVPIDVRLICATNANLEKAKETRQFRPDLYFRIAELMVHLPPLRDRSVDIPELVAHFVGDAVAARERAAKPFASDAMRVLQDYSWPGNVRELRYVVRRALLDANGPEVLSSDASRAIRYSAADSPLPPLSHTPPLDATAHASAAAIGHSSMNPDSRARGSPPRGGSASSLARHRRELERTAPWVLYGEDPVLAKRRVSRLDRDDPRKPLAIPTSLPGGSAGTPQYTLSATLDAYLSVLQLRRDTPPGTLVPRDSLAAHAMARRLVGEGFDHIVIIGPRGWTYAFFFYILNRPVRAIHVDNPATRCEPRSDLSVIGGRVLLVDDQIETGRTVRVAANALLNAGAKSVEALLGSGSCTSTPATLDVPIERLWLPQEVSPAELDKARDELREHFRDPEH